MPYMSRGERNILGRRGREEPRANCLRVHACLASQRYAISPRERGAVMSSAPGARIHPSAVVSAEAVLADDVIVGPHVVIEGPVTIGPECVLRPHVTLCGPLKMGRGNVV